MFSDCGQSMQSVQIVRLVSSAVTLARETPVWPGEDREAGHLGPAGSLSFSLTRSLSFSPSLHANGSN